MYSSTTNTAHSPSLAFSDSEPGSPRKHACTDVPMSAKKPVLTVTVSPPKEMASYSGTRVHWQTSMKMSISSVTAVLALMSFSDGEGGNGDIPQDAIAYQLGSS
ncbi:hypothetical protein M378DRAFT_524706 [Amanita muscaria Koide BX008]|uniref:Uncharacterized protein n=1 Tax=Amanita muscaria (strain Koide BX008) TaxID=946122 RepID=A0A0C2WI59_AMAMK|nr:hypothetical protein M378DRAFT_524706 [Amanita muscaria Koide BX008]